VLPVRVLLNARHVLNKTAGVANLMEIVLSVRRDSQSVLIKSVLLASLDVMIALLLINAEPVLQDGLTLTIAELAKSATANARNVDQKDVKTVKQDTSLIKLQDSVKHAVQTVTNVTQPPTVLNVIKAGLIQ